MTIRITLLLLALIFHSTTSLWAQEKRGICGTSYADQMSQMSRFMANKKVVKSPSFKAKARNTTAYLPVQFHIVTKDDGSGEIQLTDLLEQMCHLNTIYGQFGIVFYQIATPNFLPSSQIYDNHSTSSAQFNMRQQRNRDAINIWILNNASPSGNDVIGTTLGYYDPSNDWVVMKKNQIRAGNNTLAHEIGHFFSLFHPHLGWDAEPYSIEDHGNPVSSRAPDGSQTELVNGSNCETAGDRICDTPPDYNFALTWNSCNFNQNIQDPNGATVDPDESLIMSYFSDNCTSNFSAEQVDLMLADVSSSGRSFLRRNNYTPSADSIRDIPILTTPIAEAVTSSYNKVNLQWEPVAGADWYLVEVDRSSGFNIDKLKFIVEEPFMLLDNVLDADRNYFWRVTPFSPSYSCTTPSGLERFRTGISTSLIPEPENELVWKLLPNPAQNNQPVQIQMETPVNLMADIEVFSISGQQVYAVKNQHFKIGKNRQVIPLDNFNTAGIYLVRITSEWGSETQKLVIK